jgi:hypothetical protein
VLLSSGDVYSVTIRISQAPNNNTGDMGERRGEEGDKSNTMYVGEAKEGYALFRLVHPVNEHATAFSVPTCEVDSKKRK